MMMDKLSLAFDDPAMNALLKGSGQSGEFEDTALTLSRCAIAARCQSRVRRNTLRWPYAAWWTDSSLRRYRTITR